MLQMLFICYISKALFCDAIKLTVALPLAAVRWLKFLWCSSLYVLFYAYDGVWGGGGGVTGHLNAGL